MAIENEPGLKMYFLLKMVIFQPAMLVYQRVSDLFSFGRFLQNYLDFLGGWKQLLWIDPCKLVLNMSVYMTGSTNLRDLHPQKPTNVPLKRDQMFKGKDRFRGSIRLRVFHFYPDLPIWGLIRPEFFHTNLHIFTTGHYQAIQNLPPNTWSLEVR